MDLQQKMKLMPVTLLCLDEDTREGTKSDLVVREFEAVQVGTLAEFLFFSESCTNVFKFNHDLRVVLWQRGESREGPRSIRIPTLLDQPTWSLCEVRR